MADQKPQKTVGAGGDSGGGGDKNDGTFIPQSNNFNASLGQVVGKFAVALVEADVLARQANTKVDIALVQDEKGQPRPPVTFESVVAAGGGDLVKTDVSVPMIAVVDSSRLAVNDAALTLDMNVAAHTEDNEQLKAEAGGDGTASVGYGPFKAQVSVHASMSTSKESKRSSDYRSTTHAEMHMTRQPAPEGLQRIIDSMLRTTDVGLKIAEQKMLDGLTDSAAKSGVSPAPATPTS